ncbi:MAG: tetratricopeptide repeat protein [Nitrospiria bacterium]
MKRTIFYTLTGILFLILFYYSDAFSFWYSRFFPSDLQNVNNINPAAVKLNEAGLRHLEERHFEEAENSFKKALVITPKDRVLLTNLANTYLAIGQAEGEKLQYDEALSSFEKAIQLNPAISSFHYAAAWAYNKLNKPEEAIPELEESIRLNPRELEAYRLLGEIYSEMDDPDKAIEALEKALALQPNDQVLMKLISKLKWDKQIESGLEKTSTMHFIIKFEGEEKKEIAGIVSDILDRAYRDIGSIFYERLFQPVVVILYSDQAFRNTVHGPGWSRGLYDGKIRIPVQGSIKDPDGLRKVLYHEYTHAVLHQISTSPIPTWLNEGLAMYFEGGSEQDSLSRVVAQARQTGNLIPLSQLHGSFMGMNSATADLAYGESRLAVQGLIDRYSIRRVRDLIEQNRGPDSFPAVFEQVFLISYDQYNKSFLSDGT